MFTRAVSSLGLLAASVAILAVLLERTLPDADVTIRLEDLPKHLRDWQSGGSYVEVADGLKMFYRKGGKCADSVAETVILVHGFPTSSYDYARSHEILEKEFCVVMFDHVGFGFSDKPTDPQYIYSIFTAAENALEVWRQLKIRSAHIVAHDMGDSIVTEILSRRQRNMLPSQIGNDFFKSVTFTNGGMRYSLSNFRLAQTLLKTPIVGEVVNSLMCKLQAQGVSRFFSGRQFASIWSPTYTDTERMRQDISDMEALISFNGGRRLGHRTISYLHDRARFEPRWLKSLSKSEIPIMVLWGDADAVAPIEIAKSLGEEGHIGHKYLTGRTLKDVGHFLMLEAPEKWAKIISEFVRKASTNT